MAKVPLGKLLLRNVIRHTDAHNKIQEESEMWKLRDMERQTSSTGDSDRRWTARSSMHCDRYVNDPERSTRGRLGDRESLSLRDEQEARYWTRKLYEFEDNDPDRWGHSGFKELYPEEFHSDRESDDRRPRQRDKKSKRSSKRKKKKSKKRKQRTEESDPESNGSAADGDGGRPKRKSSKSKRRRKKSGKDPDASGGAGGKTDRKRSRTVTDNPREPERKKRNDCRAANEEKSDLSSDN